MPYRAVDTSSWSYRFTVFVKNRFECSKLTLCFSITKTIEVLNRVNSLNYMNPLNSCTLNQWTLNY